MGRKREDILDTGTRNEKPCHNHWDGCIFFQWIISSIGEDMTIKETSCITGKSVTQYSHFGKQFAGSLKY